MRKQKNRNVAVFFNEINKLTQYGDQPKVMTLKNDNHENTIKPMMKLNGKFSKLKMDFMTVTPQ